MSTIEQPGTTNGASAGERPTIDVINPATLKVVGSIPDMSADEVAKVAAELREAQPAWEALGPKARAEHLLNWLDWLFDNEQRILDIVQMESGKSSGDTGIETMVAVEVINYYAKNAEKFLADDTPSPHNAVGATKKMKRFYQPYQLVGQIFPWNYPLGMPMMDVPPALLAGAAVMSKPSEVVPLAWQEVVRGWREEIGAPPVLACVTGAGATGAALVDEVDFIMFTGSARTGKRIAVAAAEQLKPYALELGGKDPMIVCDDADIDRAVGGAVWSGFFNAGQSCISVERIYVQEPVYDEFVDKLTKKVSELRVGSDPGRLETDYGAMATEAQLEIVERHVKDALDKGAKVTTGGKRTGEGLCHEPTVLVDVDHSMACMREETFGPTLPVMKVKSDEEAISLANDSEYGLNGSVWTKDPERAERIARRMETGGVSANNAMATIFQFPMPFGGWKESGVGSRFGGAEGILKFCRSKSYTNERLSLSTELHWYPVKKSKSSIQNRAVRMLGARGWRRKLGLK